METVKEVDPIANNNNNNNLINMQEIVLRKKLSFNVDVTFYLSRVIESSLKLFSTFTGISKVKYLRDGKELSSFMPLSNF